MGEWSLEGIPAGYLVNRVVIVTLVASLAVLSIFVHFRLRPEHVS